jgi:hypothetical protein
VRASENQKSNLALGRARGAVWRTHSAPGSANQAQIGNVWRYTTTIVCARVAKLQPPPRPRAVTGCSEAGCTESRTGQPHVNQSPENIGEELAARKSPHGVPAHPGPLSPNLAGHDPFCVRAGLFCIRRGNQNQFTSGCCPTRKLR